MIVPTLGRAFRRVVGLIGVPSLPRDSPDLRPPRGLLKAKAVHDRPLSWVVRAALTFADLPRHSPAARSYG